MQTLFVSYKTIEVKTEFRDYDGCENEEVLVQETEDAKDDDHKDQLFGIFGFQSKRGGAKKCQMHRL